MSAKEQATNKTPAKNASATPAKNASATPAKKTSAKKAPAKKVSAKKVSAKKATSKATTKKAVTKAVPPEPVVEAKAAPKPAKKVSRFEARPTPPSERTIPAKYKYLHDPKWLAGQREALLRERASYTTSADRLAAEAAALMADREPGDVQFDEESGEGDTIAVERDRDLALSAAARQSVADIDAALARLDANTYGMCIAGDDIIPRERLEAIPEAAVCVMHKTLMF